MQRPNPEAQAEEAAELDSIEALEARGDIETLVRLAREARMAKDMPRSLAAYEAAARLGSSDAHYATALFYLTGQVVQADLVKGAAHLRAAAEGNVLPAKIYIGNLYELGVHYSEDPEKADVWYRSAARQAGVTDEPGTLEHARRMADMGCVRHYLELAAEDSTTEDQRAAWSRKARAMGYQLKARASSAPSEKSMAASDKGIAIALATTSMSSEPKQPAGGPVRVRDAGPAPSSPEPKKEEKKQEKKKAQKKPLTWLTPLLGIRAFFVELLFLGAALATGFLGSEGAKILLESGTQLPLIGARPERVYFVALAIIGVLPALLVYRARTVAAALGAAALFSGVGFYLHGSPKGTLLDPRLLQVSAFGLAGYAGALLVLGILGGAKPSKE